MTSEQRTQANGDELNTQNAPPKEPINNEKTAHLRVARIHEYLEEALGQHDRLQRCLAPLMCDLLEMCQKLKAGLDAELAKKDSFIAVLREIEPAFQMYLTMVRQVDRLAQLEVRSRAK